LRDLLKKEEKAKSRSIAAKLSPAFAWAPALLARGSATFEMIL
jgi:hypothetical protein